MCSRYYIDREVYKAIGRADLQKREGDICPSCSGPVLTAKGGEIQAREMTWGFPQYQKNGLIINARAETVREKNMFRDSVLHRRCIIPARHFYEWDKDKNKAVFYRKDAPVLYMAGFYSWFSQGQRFVILTVEANDSVRQVHSRMPLILEQTEIEPWILDEGFLDAALHKIPAQLDRFQEYEQLSLF